MQKITTLYRNNHRGHPQATLYPIHEEISTLEQLREFAGFDHVAAQYKQNKRAIKNFITSDCLVMDLDNNHSEYPVDWADLDTLLRAFDGIEFYAVTSRHHKRIKDGSVARPKYHVYFPITEITDASVYAALKTQLCAKHPYFDPAAKDAARFFFGNANAEVVNFEGRKLI
jgi:hypothetical protein